MSKVLLINPPWIIGEDKSLWKGVASCWPSLGLLYIAAVLERAGHEVSYLDCSAENFTVNDAVKIFSEKYRDCELVFLTATTPLINNALGIAAGIKKINPQVKIIVGGVHASVMPDEVMSDSAVDIIVLDEGEETALELANRKSLAEIKGIHYKSNGTVLKNPPRPLKENLDDLPPPAYHLMPFDKYFPAVGSYKKLPAMIMFATRGCPGRCTFCYRTFRGIVRKRSARNIIEEIKILRKDYGVNEIAFYDDTFTVFRAVVEEFCKILIDEKIDIAWSCFSRVDCVNEATLKLMKRAGCHLILFGIESADETILKNINKNISLDKAMEAVRLCRKVGIETRTSFMIGNPGETEATIKKSIDFAIELDPDEVQFNIATPYPGTAFFEWAKHGGHIKSFNWNDYSMSNVVFEAPGLSGNTLQYYYQLAHRKFYFRPKIIFRRMSRIRSWEQLKQEFKGVFALFNFVYAKIHK